MMQLIEDAKSAWKLFSVQIAAIWAMLFGLIAADPSLFLTVYNSLPSELREFLPPWVRWLVVFSAMTGSVYAARVIKQTPKDKPHADAAN